MNESGFRNFLNTYGNLRNCEVRFQKCKYESYDSMPSNAEDPYTPRTRNSELNHKCRNNQHCQTCVIKETLKTIYDESKFHQLRNKGI